MNGCLTGKEQRNREGREIYSLIKDFVWSENIPGSAESKCQLTVLEPPPWSWPGGHVVFESLLAAGRDTARGECLWAGGPQAPGGNVPPEVDLFTHLSLQSCFNERPGSLSAPGLCVGTKKRKLVDRKLSLLYSRVHVLQVWNTHQPCRCSRGT